MDHSNLNFPNYNRIMLQDVQDVQKSRLEDIINLYNEQ
jgi:hypothetical protein